MYQNPGGGGHSGTKRLPTAKWPHGAEAVNANIYRGGQNGGGQLQTESQIGVVTCEMCLFSFVL